jgi:hypothetical protein
MQFAHQLAPVVLLSTYRLTLYKQFQSCQHTLLLLVLSSRLLPPPIDSDIALYLRNSTSQHEHSYSKYALADCSLMFSFLSNCDRSGVYSNNTVGVAAYYFTDAILQSVG